MAPPTIERVTIDGRDYRSVREGLASILAPFKESDSQQALGKKPRNNDEGEQAVFYNPIQQFNRDLSVLAILIHGEGAIIQKLEKFQKTQNARKRKAKEPKYALTNGAGEYNSGQQLPTKKRKVDDAAFEISNNDAKRQRNTEIEFGDDDLEVLELEGNVPAHAEATEPRPDGGLQPENVSDKQRQRHTSAKENTSDPARKASVGFSILDALSATGLRALRYAKEIPFATTVVANDLSSDAVKSIDLNIQHNELSNLVRSHVGDARAFMYSRVSNEHQPIAGKNIHRFDVIDLDPYGTAAPFFDSAVQALQEGGLLCVTCTDAGVFASNGYPEKTYALYGGIPVKGVFSHEGGLRLILHAVATSAAKYGIAIEPLLSLSIDFYARLFIRIHKQQKEVKLLAGTTMMVYNCDQGCGAWSTQLIAKNQAKEDKKGEFFFKHGFAQAPSVGPTCEHCGFKTHLGGPMWAGPLHNPYFVQRILDRLPSLDKSTYQTLDRLQGMLTVALEEDLTLSSSNENASVSILSDRPSPQEEVSPQEPTIDPRIIPRLPPEVIDQSPFFFIPNYVAKIIHTQTLSEDELRGAIRHLGYRVTRSHCKPGSFRTTAPWAIIWEIMREWVRTKKPIKEDALKPGTAGWAVMGRSRNSERKTVNECKDVLAAKLKRCESLEDMKTIMQAEMYKLDHPTISNEIPHTNGVNGMESSDGKTISVLAKPSELNIVFDEKLGKEKSRGKLVRYQINPRANWGPMNRAAGSG